MAAQGGNPGAVLQFQPQQTTQPETEGDEPPSVEETELWRCLCEAPDDVDVIAEIVDYQPDTDVNMQDDVFGWTPLLIAANAGSSPLLKLLLTAKAKPDSTCFVGNNALNLAARRGHTATAEFLMSRKCNLNIKNKQGWTALHWSAINGHEEVATSLIAAAADLNAIDIDGRTACMWAARHGYLDIVEALVTCGINLSQCDDNGLTAMDHAHEHMELRKQMSAASEVNKRLIEAARRGDLDEVKQAIRSGANLGQRDENGWSPMMWAALHGSLDLVTILVRHGASPNLLDDKGNEVQALGNKHLAVKDSLSGILGANGRMLSAAKANKWEAVEAEIVKGAWVNTRDGDKRTGLMWAAKHGRPDALNMLVGRGASTDERDVFGWTATLFAIWSRSVECVSMLHYHGANFTIRSYEGDSGLHVAVRADDSIMLQVLLTSGHVEELDVEGHTPLMIAACAGLTKSASTLLAYGADVKTVERHGRSALMLAVVHGHTEVVQLMLEPVKPPPKLPQDAGTDEEGAPKYKKTHKSHDKKDKKERGPSKGRAKTKGKPVHPATALAKAEAAGGKKGGMSASSKAKLKDVNAAKDKVGESPDELIKKTIEKRTHILKKLPIHKPSHLLKEADKDDRTAFQLAVLYKRVDIIALLLEHEADVNRTNVDGESALHEAVRTNQEQVVGMLLDVNIKTSVQNNAGKTAKEIAENPQIRGMIDKYEVIAALPNSDGVIDWRGTGGKRASMKATFRVRIENLPTKSTADLLEEQIRLLFKRLGVANPLRIEVAADAITCRPKGFAFADFQDAAAADLCVRGDGADINGNSVKISRETGPVKQSQSQRPMSRQTS